MTQEKKTVFIPLHWALLIALVPAVLILFVRLAILRPVVIQSHSMEPTLKQGERVVLRDLHLWHYVPKRGDIIAVSDPLDRGTALAKRIIALSGETVQVANGSVYINGQPLQEPYLVEPIPYEKPPIVVPPGYIYVLGDHRATSEDSATWGPIPADRIIGRVIAIFWPPARSGSVK
jgi:signal peptidase I